MRRNSAVSLPVVLLAGLMACSCGWGNANSSSGCPAANVVRLSADGTCSFGESTVSCKSLGANLKFLRIALNCEVLIAVDRQSTYELVHAAVQSLSDAGFSKVGFLTKDAS